MRKHFSLVCIILCVLFSSSAVLAETISGNVSGPSAPVTDTEVQAVDASGNWVDATQTDEFGNYTLTVPGDGTYYVYTPWWALSDWTLVAEAYPDSSCLNCDVPTTGTGIVISGGSDETDINIVLATGAQVTGSVVDADDPLTPLHPVIVDIYDTSGNIWGGTWNQNDGSYALPAVPPGDYRIVYNAIQDLEPYLDELNDGTICVNSSCDLTSAGSSVARRSAATDEGVATTTQPAVIVSSSNRIRNPPSSASIAIGLFPRWRRSPRTVSSVPSVAPRGRASTAWRAV